MQIILQFDVEDRKKPFVFIRVFIKNKRINTENDIGKNIGKKY
jgi:hypothetical protein